MYMGIFKERDALFSRPRNIYISLEVVETCGICESIGSSILVLAYREKEEKNDKKERRPPLSPKIVAHFTAEGMSPVFVFFKMDYLSIPGSLSTCSLILRSGFCLFTS